MPAIIQVSGKLAMFDGAEWVSDSPELLERIQAIPMGEQPAGYLPPQHDKEAGRIAAMLGGEIFREWPGYIGVEGRIY